MPVSMWLYIAFFAPLGSFVLIPQVPQKRVRWVHSIAIFSTALSLAILSYIAYTYHFNYIIIWAYPPTHVLHNLSIMLDKTALQMMLLVFFIALLVQVFSVVYMQHEPHYRRYFSYLSLFIWSMIGLLATQNLLIIYIFWELVGLCSYLLIGFWYQNLLAGEASKKAFLVNRIGDIGFLIGIILYYRYTNTFALSAIAQVPTEAQTWIGLCVLCGAMGKSAQFPLHVWLPDAMAGPTPISALIHAATMVAAGVYLLFRASPLLGAEVAMLVAFLGAFTAFLGAFSAVFQYDIKKVLAYSTISQLGYMTASIGLGEAQGAMNHLFAHAFFKASLFLAAGAILHTWHQWAEHEQHLKIDTQDMRLMGGFAKTMPYVTLAFGISAWALMGMPLSVSFVTKEAIIEASWYKAINAQNQILYLIPLFLLLSVFITAFYISRQFLMIFIGKNRVLIQKYQENDGNLATKLPQIKEILLILPILLLAGVSIDWTFWQIHLSGVALLSIVLSIAGASWAWIQYKKNPAQVPLLKNKTLKNISLQAFYIDNFYSWLWKYPLKKIILFLIYTDKKIDNITQNTIRAGLVLGHFVAWIDYYLVDGIIRLCTQIIGFAGRNIQKIHQGTMQQYFTWSVLFVLLLIYFWLS